MIDRITQNEFDKILFKILSKKSINDIIKIPGIYDILSDFYINDIFDFWEKDKKKN